MNVVVQPGVNMAETHYESCVVVKCLPHAIVNIRARAKEEATVAQTRGGSQVFDVFKTFVDEPHTVRTEKLVAIEDVVALVQTDIVRHVQGV